MAEKKRGPPPSKDPSKQTKRQRKSAAASAKQSYHKPKPQIHHIDTPLHELLPHQRIDLIAELSEACLEDPTSAVSSSRTALDATANDNDDSSTAHQYVKTQSKLQTLLNLSTPSVNGHDGHAARLAILSLLAIYTDILPAYRIRLPTESELSVKVSKEIKNQWDYERRLLGCYQRYLTLLERTWEDGKFGNCFDEKQKRRRCGVPTTLAATAILALSQLVSTCYNFNFRSNLLSIVIRTGNHSNVEIRSSCCRALKVMFEKDVGGEASLEAVRRIAKLLKEKRKGGIHPDLLGTWMALPLRVHEDEAVAGEFVFYCLLMKHIHAHIFTNIHLPYYTLSP